jgi:hypothetical protein
VGVFVGNSEKTIFVAVGAYNESYLDQTIRNCIDMAKYPERLHFGIWTLNNDDVIPSFPDLPNVKIITAQYPTLLGVCSSRMGAIFLYNNEDYYMQIDAHMLFQKNWDEVVVNAYENIKIKESCELPLITTYVPWWANNEDGSLMQYTPDSDWKSYPMRYSEDGHTRAPVPVQETYNVDWQGIDYYEHYGLSAHFIFTSGRFAYEILPDIQFMFFGEEMTTAVRAWTRGYRIFCIPDPIVWHYNKGAGVLYKNDRWVTIGDEKLYQDFLIKQEYSHLKTRLILTGEVLGYWGAASLESLDAYQKAANFSFKEFYKKLDNLTNNE